MLNFYFPIINFIQWPFHTVSKDLVEQRKQELFQNLSLSFKPNVSLKLSCQLAINFMRHKKKKFIQKVPSSESIDPIRKEIISPLTSLYSRSIPLEYQQQELDYIASLGIIASHCAESMENTNAIICFHTHNNTPANRFYNSLLEEFNRVYPALVDFSDPNFHFRLLTKIVYALTYPGLSLDSGTIVDTLAYYSSETPYLIKNLTKIVKIVYSLPEFSKKLISINDFILELFFILSEFTEIDQLEKPVLIKIIAHHPGREGTMKRTLQKRVNLNLKIDTSGDKSEKDTIYDLILSESDHLVKTSLKSKSTYSWIFPPSHRDWENIEEILNDITHKNS